MLANRQKAQARMALARVVPQIGRARQQAVQATRQANELNRRGDAARARALGVQRDFDQLVEQVSTLQTNLRANAAMMRQLARGMARKRARLGQARGQAGMMQRAIRGLRSMSGRAEAAEQRAAFRAKMLDGAMRQMAGNANSARRLAGPPPPMRRG